MLLMQSADSGIRSCSCRPAVLVAPRSKARGEHTASGGPENIADHVHLAVEDIPDHHGVGCCRMALSGFRTV